MPLVILDGPEAAGKTTIQQALTSYWGDNSRVRNWGPRDSWLEYCQPLFEDTRECNEHPTRLIVWSRCWLSRSVYNKLLSQGQSVPPKATLELDNIVVGSGGLLILVTAPVSVLMERRIARLMERDAKPDHPLEPRKELAEFQLGIRGRKWRTLSGVDDPDYNVRNITTMLVQRNNECRMSTRLEGSVR